jgi:hypothetical protein
MAVTVGAAQEPDRDAVVRALNAAWVGTVVVGHGVRYDSGTLPARSPNGTANWSAC